MLWGLAADGVMLLHLGFVLFVVAGGLLAWRWRWLAWAHLPSALWGVAIELGGWLCPLTPLENALRRRAGEAGYLGDFVDHYLGPVLYPAGLTSSRQVALAVLVLGINALAYAVYFRRRTERERPVADSLRVQFAHGFEGSPQGVKARLFDAHFTACTPAMDTHDFESCVQVHAETLRSFGPDVLVGSSFGAGVVVALLQRGLWCGPTLLLAQAALRRMPDARLPAGVPVWLVHGTRDELIDPEESRRLADTGEPERVRLSEVDDDHSLHASSASGRLTELVLELAACGEER